MKIPTPIWVTRAEYSGGYSLTLTFSDGRRALADLSDLVCTAGGLLAPLRDGGAFRNFRLDGWTVTWLDGRLDIAPESLYARSR